MMSLVNAFYENGVNRAEYQELLRVPGIGVKSARRIAAARRSAVLDFPDLKKMGVVLKRAVYFITCQGKTMYPISMDADFIARQLLGEERRRQWEIGEKDVFRQLSLFDDGMLGPVDKAPGGRREPHDSFYLPGLF